ncbi:hypothetical protein T492DRAFT_1096996 [Pavlovales sp. CCMP2436]|nr:hypothetical protein T492DRAFT_1096996 [Pavlovales sp. CCMP2436]
MGHRPHPAAPGVLASYPSSGGYAGGGALANGVIVPDAVPPVGVGSGMGSGMGVGMGVPPAGGHGAFDGGGRLPMGRRRSEQPSLGGGLASGPASSNDLFAPPKRLPVADPFAKVPAPDELASFKRAPSRDPFGSVPDPADIFGSKRPPAADPFAKVPDVAAILSREAGPSAPKRDLLGGMLFDDDPPSSSAAAPKPVFRGPSIVLGGPANPFGAPRAPAANAVQAFDLVADIELSDEEML